MENSLLFNAFLAVFQSINGYSNQHLQVMVLVIRHFCWIRGSLVFKVKPSNPHNSCTTIKLKINLQKTGAPPRIAIEM